MGHRVWYVRSGDTILWDRKQKLDMVFGSGMTRMISSGNMSDEAKAAATEPAQRIAEASSNLEKLEQERQHALEVKLHAERPGNAAALVSGSRDVLMRRSLIQALFRAC